MHYAWGPLLPGGEQSAGGAGPQTVEVTGLGSVQAFGTLELDIAFSVGGLSSAGAFGTPNVTLGGAGQDVPVSGLASAQAFGTLTILPGNVNVGVSGLGSAQQFGTVEGDQTYHMVGLGSAQAFGIVNIIEGGVAVQMTGLGSAQQFGSAGVTTPGGAGFDPALYQRQRRRRR
jgi:hypothetical protein